VSEWATQCLLNMVPDSYVTLLGLFIGHLAKPHVKMPILLAKRKTHLGAMVLLYKQIVWSTHCRGSCAAASKEVALSFNSVALTYMINSVIQPLGSLLSVRSVRYVA
jgi:hypothetical protein